MHNQWRFNINIRAPSLNGLYRTIELALDLGGGGGSYEFRVGLAPIFQPPQHFSNEHSLM